MKLAHTPGRQHSQQPSLTAAGIQRTAAAEAKAGESPAKSAAAAAAAAWCQQQYDGSWTCCTVLWPQPVFVNSWTVGPMLCHATSAVAMRTSQLPATAGKHISTREFAVRGTGNLAAACLQRHHLWWSQAGGVQGGFLDILSKE